MFWDRAFNWLAMVPITLSAFLSLTLQRNVRTNMRILRLFLGYSPQQAYSGRPAGFIFTCLYSSKIVVQRSSTTLIVNNTWVANRQRCPYPDTHRRTCIPYDGLLAMADDMFSPSPMHIKYVSYVYDGLCI